jgi:ParB-like chromosome segregation protein Spo0J
VKMEHASVRISASPYARTASAVTARPTALSAVEMVPISTLLPADSPRLDGENADHTRVLADSEATLPPIVVHRSTMRVIDGMHRLRAALLRGQRVIPVRFFDGSEPDAFVLAVEANATHGLPLSAADRTAAATRILASHPYWSDRAVSSVAGLSAKTVAALRRSTTGENARQEARTGSDGRVRPLSSASARMLASQLIADNPSASLREIAHRAGTSPSTVRDVRHRMKRGEHPVPLRQRSPEPATATPSRSAAGPVKRIGTEPGGPVPQQANRLSTLEALSNDPSLRHTDSGRYLLRLLSTHAIPE